VCQCAMRSHGIILCQKEGRLLRREYTSQTEICKYETRQMPMASCGRPSLKIFSARSNSAAIGGASSVTSYAPSVSCHSAGTRSRPDGKTSPCDSRRRLLRAHILLRALAHVPVRSLTVCVIAEDQP
jgi:hypothetical protein